MEWTAWNWLNLFFVFFNLYIAVTCFRDGRDSAGHLNMFAVVINGWCVALRLGL